MSRFFKHTFCVKSNLFGWSELFSISASVHFGLGRQRLDGVMLGARQGCKDVAYVKVEEKREELVCRMI